MRKSIFAALTIGIFVTACVNKDYDLKKFDKSVTLFEEGVCEIPLEETVISTADLLGGDDLPFGEDNKLKIEAEKVEAVLVGVVEADLVEGYKIDKTINIAVDGIPEFLSRSECNLVFPEKTMVVDFEIQNPTDKALDVFANIYADDQMVLEGARVGSFAEGEVKKSMSLDLSDKLNRYPKAVIIRDIVLRSPAAAVKSGIETRKTDASGLIERSFYVASAFTLAGMIMQGSKVAIEIPLDRTTINFLGFKDDLKKYNVESFILSGKAKNTVPMRVDATSTGDLVATLKYEYDPANLPDDKTGFFTLDATAPGGLDSIKKFNAKVSVEILPFPLSFKKTFVMISELFFELEAYSVRPKGVTIGEE